MTKKTKEQKNDIRIFISHAFAPDPAYYKIDEFRDTVRGVIDAACAKIKLENAGFRANPIIEMQSQIERLPGQVIANLTHSQLAIVDISGNNPNVFFEYGYLRARNIPCILLKSRHSAAVPIPTDLQGEFINFYNDIAELSNTLLEELARQISQVLSRQSYEPDLLNRIWFRESVEHIWIVSSSEHTKSEFASRASPDYVFLDNIGDRDAVLECCMFLARRYPRAKISIHASDQFDYRYISQDIVVIGGPGDEREGNAVCDRIMKEISSNVFYSDTDRLVTGGKEYSAKYDDGVGVAMDYGYFGRMPNPFDATKSVILINGIHTFGVLGSARAFTDGLVGMENMRIAVSKSSSSAVGQVGFECFFDVTVFPTGEISVPRLRPERVMKLMPLRKN